MQDAERIEPSTLGRMTRRRLLQILQRQGPSSRAEIVRASGLSAPTVSKAAAALIEEGLVEDRGPSRSAGGRPGRLLGLAAKRARVVGVVLDADRVELQTAGLDASHPEAPQRLERPRSYADLLRQIEEAVVALEGKRQPVLALGISSPGLLDSERNRILLSPNLPMLNDREPARDLEARLGRPVFLMQETHALCCAERSFGAARNIDHFAVLDAGSGLGLGVMERGRLLLGQRGLSGELGHLIMDPAGLACGCGRRGCLETRATDAALARALSRRVRRRLSIGDALDRVCADPERYRDTLDETVHWFATALAAVVNLYNPERIFVVSRWLARMDDCFEAVVDATAERALGPSLAGCRIERSQLGKLQGAIAAAVEGLIGLPASAS